MMFMGFVEGLFWVLIFHSFDHRRRLQFSSVLDLDSGRLFEVGAPAGCIGRIFEAWGLLTFSAFRMGAYSK